MVAEDLQRLDVLHDLLAVLNDSRQGAKRIAGLVAKLPVLEARVRRAHHGRTSPSASVSADIATILAMIGNQAFEALLLELLEDLTILSATLEPEP